MTDIRIFLVSFLPFVWKFEVESRTCNFNDDDNSRSIWGTCECELITADAVKVNCRSVAWLTVPSVPSFQKTKQHMTSLSITHGNLMFISYDAFRDQNIQVLDLSSNAIDSINLHAFRGLENRLYQLVLDNNVLTRIPSKQIEKLEQLRYLHLKNNRIDVVEAGMFKHARLNNLRYLYLDNNLIEAISTDAFVNLNLNVLTLNNNQIQNIDGNSLPATLWYISLKENKLESIPYDALESLSELQILDLEGNSISQLQSYVPTIFMANVSINLSSNRIRNIPAAAFSSFRHIENLDLSYNIMKTVHSEFLQGVATMTSLDLSRNRLSFLPPNAFNNIADSLKKLSLEENDFNAVPEALAPLRSLTHLNIISNKLALLHLRPTWRWNESLKELLLSHNFLTRIAQDMLTSFPKLEHLDISQNYIDNLSELSPRQKEVIASKVVRLNLAGNNLKVLTDPSVFLSLSSMAYLDLSHNEIFHISDTFFMLTPGLESISMEDNRLSSLPVRALRNVAKLRYLVLDHNSIRTLPTEKMYNLVYLERISLAHNQIHAVTYDSFPGEYYRNLRSINCAFNKMQFLAPKSFRNLPFLEMVNLQGNNFRNVHMYTFINLSSVREIDLSRNEIDVISEAAFVNLPRLQYLSLRYNKLSSIHPDMFVHVIKLEALDLSGNQLATFDSHFLRQIRELRSIDLSRNSLSSLNLGHLKKTLMELNLRSNRLKVVDEQMFSDMPLLRRLDLAHNFIGHVYPGAWNAATWLTELYLNANMLSHIKKGTFQSAEKMNMLDISSNQISRLDAGCFGGENLLRLNLSSNLLGKIPYEALSSLMKSLSWLDLSFNSIESVEPELFSELRNMTQLLLNSNRIKSISEAAFKGLRKLRLLDLSGNPIDEWNPNAFREVSQSLESVNLADTGLYSVPNFGGRALKELNLSRNHITDLSMEHSISLNKLETLDVSFNRIRELTIELLQQFGALRSLNISYNPLEQLTKTDLASLSKLEVFSCHHMSNLNKVDKEGFKGLKRLHSLEMYDVGNAARRTNIEDIVGYLPPLRMLRMQIVNRSLSNQFADLDARYLRYLYLDAVGVDRLDPHAFGQLRGYYVQLSLVNSQVAYFSPQIFSTLSHVRYITLDLSNNRFRSLNPFMVSNVPIINPHGTILLDIDLRNNLIHCDDKMDWVRKWLQYLERTTEPEIFKMQLEKWNRTICYTPEQRTGYSLVQIYMDNSLGSNGNVKQPSLKLCLSVLFILLMELRI
ncbi:leucine Rich repeat-containing domain protein [Trichuris suis]|nr:leucine Rich repeat-containing domain protein [Trichuris suis]